MATETQTAPAPELTILHRVANIPLVASSLDKVHSTLVNNTYTRQPYNTAQELSKAALSYTEPIQKRLAPLLVRADDYANKGLDAVESRYPYPFKTPTEDITKDLMVRRDHAYEMLNQLKAQNVLVQRAADAAERVNAVASGSLNAAQEKVHALSTKMIEELKRVQTSTSNLPGALQSSFHDVSAHLSQTISDLTNILTSQDPFSEKVHKVRDTVQERVQPVLEATAVRVQEMMGTIRGKTAETAQTAQQNGVPTTSGSNTTSTSTSNSNPRSRVNGTRS